MKFERHVFTNRGCCRAYCDMRWRALQPAEKYLVGRFWPTKYGKLQFSLGGTDDAYLARRMDKGAGWCNHLTLIERVPNSPQIGNLNGCGINRNIITNLRYQVKAIRQQALSGRIAPHRPGLL